MLWWNRSTIDIEEVRMGVKRKSLAANALLNGIKQCCVILFPLITFPYVSRVLGPTNYGKVSFALSIISYITFKLEFPYIIMSSAVTSVKEARSSFAS